MEDRPDLDPALPRYTIRYLRLGEWKESQFKMTEAYAAKQYKMTQWEIVPESKEYRSADDMPIIGSNQASRFQAKK
jgi:hypothetical protein